MASVLASFHIVHAANMEINFGASPLFLGTRKLIVKAISPDVGLITITCPRNINGKVLHMYPPNLEPGVPLKVIAVSYGRYRDIPVSQVLRHSNGRELISVSRSDTETRLMVRIDPGLLVRDDYDAFYIVCGEVDIHMSHKVLTELLRSLFRIQYFEDSQWYAHLDGSPIQDRMIGVAKVRLAGLPAVQRGCGNLALPIYSRITEFDETAAVPTCIVDIMETQFVGFYCKDGFFDPPDCFSTLYMKSTHDTGITINLDAGVERTSFGELMVASFKSDMFRHHFQGYCRCIVPDEAGKNLVERARIIVGNKTEYVVNITNMIMKNRVAPIKFPWYDLTLNSGTSLLIKFPPTAIYYTKDDVSNSMIAAQRPPISGMKPRYITTIQPNDPTKKLLTLTPFMDCNVEEVNYDNFLAGDALQIDTSKLHEGEMTIRYRSGRPLAYKTIRSLLFRWRLYDRVKGGLGNLYASIGIHLAPNYDYYRGAGCSPPDTKIFPRVVDSKYYRNTLRTYSFGVVNFCELTTNVISEAKIYCPPDFTLEPQMCLEVAYDSTRENIIPMPSEVRSRFDADTGITYVNTLQNEDMRYSMSCSCLNQDGAEVARFDINNMTDIIYVTSADWGAYLSDTLSAPCVILAPTKSEEGIPVQEVNEINLGKAKVKNIVNMKLGTRLNLLCIDANYNDTFAQMRPARSKRRPFTHTARRLTEPFYLKWYSMRDIHDPADFEERWFPLNLRSHFYRIIEDRGVTQLVATPYSDVITTSNLSYRIFHSQQYANRSYSSIYIELPENAIVISKENNKHQNITLSYACAGLSYSLTKQHRNYSRINIAQRSSRTYNTPLSSDDELNDADISDDIPYFVLDDHSEDADVRRMRIMDVVKVKLPITDPYLHGCGVEGLEEDFFKGDTIPLTNAEGKSIGCTVDLAQHHKAAFYCPLPYKTIPPGCGMVTKGSTPDAKKSAVPSHIKVSRSRNFYVFKESLWFPFRNMYQRIKSETFSCKCVTQTGMLLSTIQIT